MSAISPSLSRSWHAIAQAVWSSRPNGRRPAVIVAAGAAAVAFASAMIALGWRYDGHSLVAYGHSVTAFVIAAAIGLAFLAAGLVAWWYRPDNLIGRLMVAAGAVWYASGLQFSGSDALYALGYWLAYLPPVIVGHIALAYPDGRLRRRAERWGVAASYLVYLTIQAIRYLHEGTCHTVGLPAGAGCAGPLLGGLVSLDALVFDALFTFWVVQHWRAASRPAKRIHAPVWLAFFFHSAVLAASVTSSLLGMPQGIQLALVLGYGLCLLVLPFAFLSGLLRVRLARHRVTDLVLRLDGSPGPTRLRDLLAEALGDPSLVLGLWSEPAGTYVDHTGTRMVVPAADPGGGRAVTFVERRGRRLAVLVHDPSLVEQRSLVEATVAAARLALENARLAEAALNERRSIERDLHDGLQHRLLRLSWLADQVGATTDEPGARPLLAELASDARDAYARLRELASGIHPAILTERGLAAAVEERVLRVGVPVLVDLPPERCLLAVEAAAYFTISEALTNAVKHASAGRVTVRGRMDGGRLRVEIADDGAGGADPAGGTGLRGLQDRAAALGGTLDVRSAPGLGTAIVLELPCA